MVGVAVLAVYRTTLLRGVGLWDTAEAQAVPVLGGTMHPTGFPAWVVLGWIGSHALAPLGDAAFRMNLLSAGYLALAAALLVPILRRLDVPLVVAIAAGLGLGLTQLPWRVSAAADVHALHLALLAVLVLALLRWEARVRDGAEARSRDRALLVAAAAGGLALGGHALTLLLAPAVLAYVAAVDRAVYRRPRFLLALLGVTVGVAALLYLQLPLSGVHGAALVYGRPDTFTGFWSIVLARQFQGDFVESLGSLGGAPVALVRLAGEQFGVLALLLLPAFAVTAWRRPAYALLSGMAALLTCAFAALYVNADIARYYLGPVLFAWTWLGVLAGTGVDLVTGRLRVAGAPGSRSPPGRCSPRSPPSSPSGSCLPRRPSCWASDAGWSTARRTRRWHTGSTTRWPASTRAPWSCPGGRIRPRSGTGPSSRGGGRISGSSTTAPARRRASAPWRTSSTRTSAGGRST